jgi:hypothetical protein
MWLFGSLALLIPTMMIALRLTGNNGLRRSSYHRNLFYEV